MNTHAVEALDRAEQRLKDSRREVGRNGNKDALRVKQVYRRRVAAATVAAFALTGLGALIGWNLHEGSDVRANYIADLPSCQEVE